MRKDGWGSCKRMASYVQNPIVKIDLKPGTLIEKTPQLITPADFGCKYFEQRSC